MCVREREGGRERESVCVERERVCVCVERESVCVCLSVSLVREHVFENDVKSAGGIGK